MTQSSQRNYRRASRQENNFWKDCEKIFPSMKLLKDTFELIDLNEINHSKRTAKNTKIYLYIFCFSAKSSTFSSPFRLVSLTATSPYSGLPYKTTPRARSTLKYGQLARFASRAFGAALAIPKNASEIRSLFIFLLFPVV